MRWLIGLLVLANLVLFLWGQWYPRRSEPGGREIGAQVPGIRLWSEVAPITAGEGARPPQVAAVGPVEPIATPEVPEPEPVATPEAPAADPVAMPEVLAAEPDLTVEAARPVPVEASPILAEPAIAEVLQQPPADVALWPEANSAELPVVPAEPAAPSPEPVAAAAQPAPPARVCGEVRGLDDESAAAVWLEAFEASGLAASLRSDTVTRQTGYWVLLPPQSNLTLARRKRGELREAGVNDLWLFTEGPMRNSISLGMFRGSLRAERRAAEIRALGFDAEVRAKMTDETEYVIAYALPEARLDVLDALGLEQAGLTNRAVECPSLP